CFDILFLGTDLNTCIKCAQESSSNKVIQLERNKGYGSIHSNEPLLHDKRIKILHESGDINRLPYYPAHIPSKGPLVDLLIESGVAEYVEFKKQESLQIFSDNRLVNVPVSKEDVFLMSETSLLQKRQVMKVINLARMFDELKNGQEVEGFTLQDLKNTSFRKFLDNKLPAVFVDMVLFSLALFSTYDEAESMDAEKGFEILAKRVEGFGFFGKYSLLYPIYGSSEIAQGFCRKSALNGAVQILNVSKISVEKFEDMYKVNIESGSIDEPSYFYTREIKGNPFELCEIFGLQLDSSKLWNGAFIKINSKIKEQFKQITFPPNDERGFCIQVYQVGDETFECEKDQSILFLQSFQSDCNNWIKIVGDILEKLGISDDCIISKRIFECLSLKLKDELLENSSIRSLGN
ncbi:hypothetical protein ROZALSC1DRAFT_29369, partial [Rozella allomycis CSF55]